MPATEWGPVQIWPETLGRLLAFRNVLATVVDIGAKTDYTGLGKSRQISA